MSSALRDLEASFPRTVRDRGQRYFAEQRVSGLRITAETVGADVRGSRRYHVELTPSGEVLQASCECQYFESEGLCKHIWASLLALDQKAPGFLSRFEIVEEGELFSPGNAGDDYPVFPRRATSTPSRTQRLPSPWEVMLSNLEYRAQWGNEERRGDDLRVPAEVAWVLDASDGFNLNLLTYGRFPKKNGELGILRRANLSPAAVPHLTPQDAELIALLSDHDFGYRIPPQRLQVLMPRLAATGRLYFLRSTTGKLEGPLQYDERVWDFRVEVKAQDDGFLVSGAYVSGDETLPLDAALRLLNWLIVGNRIARLQTSGSSSWLETLSRTGPVVVPPEGKEKLSYALAAFPQTHSEVPPDLQMLDVEPLPSLTLAMERGDTWLGSFAVLYGDQKIVPSSSVVASAEGRFIRRRHELESEFAGRLKELGFVAWPEGKWHLSDRLLPKALSTLSFEGWRIELEGHELQTAGDLKFEVESGIDWFDVDGSGAFGDQSIGLPRLLDAARKKEKFVRLDDGSIGMISPEWMESLESLLSAGSQKGGSLRFSRNQITLLDTLLASRREAEVDADFAKLRDRLRSPEGIEPIVEPPGFGTELRPYQRTGLGWLHFMRETRFGGCLADDMGLGKTVQALALLEGIRQQQTPEERRPSLIVAPRSLMFNWKAEAARFAPELRVLDHHGIERVRDAAHFRAFDLILTTYATLQRDITHLAELELEYVLLDEAQAIKNASSQSAKAVKALRPRHRLALSGTPIENHLGELWSLFDFLNPGMLGPMRVFSSRFGGKNAPLETREQLARIIRPFVLRRTKSMVLRELPEKDEQTLWVELPEAQRRDYDELREHYRSTLLGRVHKLGMAKSKIFVLEALLRLRQAALHPALIDPDRSEESSAKLEAIEAELTILADGGHKALVFSQFTGMLDLVQRRLVDKDISFVRLDGKTRKREELVNAFQDDPEISVFLISLKAGGVGLNLTAASYVYLLDPWWNPAVEAQAVDRAHRIGQIQKVTATRIVATDTVEEKILDLQRSKKALADSIIRAEEGMLRGLDVTDLEMLLS